MPGYYKKAPLVYMSVVLKTTRLPKLTADQYLTVDQKLAKIGLPTSVDGEVKELRFDFRDDDLNVADTLHQDATVNRYPRKGYFSGNREESLVVASESIEWRTTNYRTYDDVCGRMEIILDVILKAVDGLYDKVHVNEITLNYADVIVPFPGRALKEYFKKGDSALPLGFLDSDPGDVERIGNVQVNRVVAPTRRVFISIEQIPVDEKGHLRKLMPQALLEMDKKFSMPINYREFWKNVNSSDYALVMSQASELKAMPLDEFDFSKETKTLQELVGTEFKSLINKDVCRADWHYEERE